MAPTPQRGAGRLAPRQTGKTGAASAPKARQFTYHDDDPSVVSQHATAPSGAWDSFIKSGIPLFRPKEGLHTIRILPRTFDVLRLNNEWAFTVDPHWGLKVFVHRSIGPDKASYLCRRLMLGEPCSLCSERQLSAGDVNALKQLQVGTRYIAWVIDRKNVSAGPQIWNMPPTQVEQEICKRQEDRDTHQIIKIDHPLTGYDVEFEVKKQGDFHVFTGVSIKRSPSPVSDDPALFAFDSKTKAMSGKWAEVIHETPLDQALRFYDDAYLLQVYNGETQRPDADLDGGSEQNTSAAQKETGREEDQGIDDSGGVETGQASQEEDGEVEENGALPPPEVIFEFSEEELAEFCEQQGLGFDMADYDNDITVARDAVIGEFYPDWTPPEAEAEADEEQQPEPEPEVRRPAPRRPAQHPAASAAKPATTKPVTTNSGGTPAQQASARLAALRARAGAGSTAKK
jgi:hypothetical protein